MLKTLRMDGEDLSQELAICLLKAIERYEEGRGAKPSTYYFKALLYSRIGERKHQKQRQVETL
jgi:DNA-directed RNA polymerase specialized sigma24 family protein